MYPTIDLSRKGLFSLCSQRGIGLVEVMIGMTLGLVLLAGISGYFISGKKTDNTAEGLNQISENARYISGKLGLEIRMAGYTGPVQLTPTNLLNSATTLAYQYSVAITGFNNVTSGALPVALNIHLTGDAQPLTNTDVLILRTTRDMQPVPLSVNSTASTATVVTNINAAVRTCNVGTAVSGICAGDVLLISDYRKAAVFQASAITEAGAISHAASGTPGNATVSWSGSDLSFGSNSEIIPYQTVTYYIANNADHVPTLYRKENAAVAVALIPGVANMQITYGEDTDNDKSVDAYRDAAAVTNWSNVLSIRVALLMTSRNDNLVTTPVALSEPALPSGATTATDRRLYKPLIFTAALRNRVQ